MANILNWSHRDLFKYVFIWVLLYYNRLLLTFSNFPTNRPGVCTTCALLCSVVGLFLHKSKKRFWYASNVSEKTSLLHQKTALLHENTFTIQDGKRTTSRKLVALFHHQNSQTENLNFRKVFPVSTEAFRSLVREGVCVEVEVVVVGAGWQGPTFVCGISWWLHMKVHSAVFDGGESNG